MDQQPIRPHRPSIVIVEDDASLLAALVFALEEEGFAVHAYRSGKPLLAAPVHAECLVVDMRLPELDGLTVIRQLRERGVWSPAILITTNPDAQTRRNAETSGVLIVEKPLMTGELSRRIDELIAANDG
ncbi:MAG: response regulator [Caulobacterales bacterium]